MDWKTALVICLFLVWVISEGQSDRLESLGEAWGEMIENAAPEW